MTAAIAPTWMTAVNAVTASDVDRRPSIRSTIVRCPVLDTGRYSVRPSTTPSTAACSRFTSHSVEGWGPKAGEVGDRRDDTDRSGRSVRSGRDGRAEQLVSRQPGLAVGSAREVQGPEPALAGR